MKNLILKLQVWKDTRGQDLIEYALMAGFVAVAAGAIMPGIATSISTIFSKVASVMTAASTQGSKPTVRRTGRRVGFGPPVFPRHRCSPRQFPPLEYPQLTAPIDSAC